MAPPVLPFPFPLRIGTDICQVSRISRILSGPRGPRFVRRVLAEEEWAQPSNRASFLLRDSPPVDIRDRNSDLSFSEGASPVPPATKRARKGVGAAHDIRGAAVYMAGRFAAKEAVIKAHPHRRLSFHDIVICRSVALGGAGLGSGPPVAVVRAPGNSVGSTSEPGREAMLSISHDGDYATAVCMAFDPPKGEAAKGQSEDQ